MICNGIDDLGTAVTYLVCVLRSIMGTYGYTWNEAASYERSRVAWMGEIPYRIQNVAQLVTLGECSLYADDDTIERRIA